MNCDNVRNAEGVWIHFGLIVYLIFKVKTVQYYYSVILHLIVSFLYLNTYKPQKTCVHIV